MPLTVSAPVSEVFVKGNELDPLEATPLVLMN